MPPLQRDLESGDERQQRRRLASQDRHPIIRGAVIRAVIDRHHPKDISDHWQRPQQTPAPVHAHQHQRNAKHSPKRNQSFHEFAMTDYSPCSFRSEEHTPELQSLMRTSFAASSSNKKHILYTTFYYQTRR